MIKYLTIYLKMLLFLLLHNISIQKLKNFIILKFCNLIFINKKKLDFCITQKFFKKFVLF